MNIPDWKLERYLLKELDDAETAQIRQALQRDESLRARVEALERSNHEIHEKYPPHLMGHRIREKLGGGRSTARSWWPVRIPRAVLVPAGILAAIALSILIIPNVIPPGLLTDTEVTRIKGSGSELRLYRKTNGGSQQLEDGDSAAEGDVVLVRYQAGEEAYGVIVSVDGRGKITTHLPTQVDQAASLEPGRSRFLDFAYELDDAPHWEVFLFVTSPSPFRVATVVQALEQLPFLTRPREVGGVDESILEVLDLPDDFRISSFTLIKDSRHAD